MSNFEQSKAEKQLSEEQRILDAKKWGVSPENIAYNKDLIDKNTFVAIVDVGSGDVDIFEKLGPSSTIDGNISLRDVEDPINLQPNTIYTQNMILGNCGGLEAIPQGSMFGAFGSNKMSNKVDIQNCENFKEIEPGCYFNSKVYIDNCPSFESLPANQRFQEDFALKNCPAIQEIPEGIIFNSIVELENLENLENIGENVRFANGVSINNCPNLKSIDKNIKFSGLVIIKNCPGLTNISRNVTFEEGSTLEIDDIGKLNSQTQEMLDELQKNKHLIIKEINK